MRRAGLVLTLGVLAGCSSSASPAQPVVGTEALRYAAPGGDGDSWKDTAGTSYRLGLINTPELAECFGSAARDRRILLTQQGFRAQVYAKDRYGRAVASVTLPDGRNLNVELARTGYADDRYLEDFRDENPSLASRLDEAFQRARDEGRGLWRACPRQLGLDDGDRQP